MVARQERIDAFDHEGSPPTDKRLEILCEDHIGTYVIPFLCQSSDGTWQNAKTRRSIEAAVIGWRETRSALNFQILSRKFCPCSRLLRTRRPVPH